jgi:hypothetical protein
MTENIKNTSIENTERDQILPKIENEVAIPHISIVDNT